MKPALWIPLSLCLLAVSALADDTDSAAIAAARDYVLTALPGQCDETPEFGDSNAYTLSWKPDWGDGSEPDEQITLYRVFCFAGAYNEIHAYVFKPKDADFSLIGFAEPAYSVVYEDGDENQTRLKNPPQVTGFSATSTLINSDFDAATNTLTSFTRWRGLGDAWSSGTWEFRSGQFVLTGYEIDPTYEANDDAATDEQRDKFYKIYP